MKKSMILLMLWCVGFGVFAQDTDSTNTISIMQIDAFNYAALEATGSYEQHGLLFQQLYQTAGMQGISMDGAPFSIYYNSPSDAPEDSLKWELCLEIKADAEVDSPFVKKAWNYTTLAVNHYEGSFSDEAMGQAFGSLFAWITKKGYQPAGPMMQKFLGMPTEGDDGEWTGKIDIVMPVTKTE